jgi:beta-glucosidase
VDPPGGNAIMPPGKGATHWRDQIWFPTSPVKAVRAKLPGTKIDFDPGTDLKSAVSLAKSADLAIVVAYQWLGEEQDVPDLSLPNNQDALIEQVAAANPRIVVVLETGTAVKMPWIDKVAGVVEAWFAGSAGHKALANVLVGEVNPSGKLAITFPKDENDLPHPVIQPAPPRNASPTENVESSRRDYAVDYHEGAKVGYKWYESENKQPLFPFGFGLSYTSYEYSGLKVDSAGKTAQFMVKNTGKRAGTEIAQVYARPPKSVPAQYKRLVGWKRVTLGPGEAQTITVAIDARPLQTYEEENNRWNFASGDYEVLVGPSSASTPLAGTLIVR